MDSIKKSIKSINQNLNQCIYLYDQRDTVNRVFNAREREGVFECFFFFFFLILQFRKLKINDLNEKCNLLEQSLRVIAQENHDLEKITNNTNSVNMLALKTQASVKSSITNSDEEFYDIGTFFFFFFFLLVTLV